MANLERKAKGAVTNEALSNISAEYSPQRKIILGADSSPFGLKVDYPDYWLNIQPDKDVYYSWSKRTKESLFTSEEDEITFEDNTLNGWANCAGVEALTSVSVDSGSKITGTYCLSALTASAVANNDGMYLDTAFSMQASKVYLIRFYALGSSLSVANADYAQVAFYDGATSLGAGVTGTYTAISGRIVSSVPVVESNSVGYYEFLFEPTEDITAYLHVYFQNTTGSALRLYMDDISVVSVESSKYVHHTALDTETALHLYGNTEYERRIRWGESDDRSVSELYFFMQRKVSATTNIRVAMG